ncbi:MAG TPA: hypothetical protein VIM12_12255 [Noviherbaspirillum sp.]|jgi:hypothetical protein|uniref:hypothetical protein n=1 Tax=Noviherbaspirillum sp. TaxID=1926288 RepID=UPI002F92BF96
MRLKATASLCVSTLFLAGCAMTTPPPTYKYVANSADPTISFESDFVLQTHFFVNTRAAEDNRCADFDRAGYLLKKDSIFIYDKANHQLALKAPADVPVAVRGYHHFSDGTFTSHCGPLTTIFTPEKSKKYAVKMNVGEKVCFMSVNEVEGAGAPRPVKTAALQKCQ